MKTDTNGCTQVKPGQEQWEEYASAITGKTQVQYDYRTPQGTLFSCVSPSLDAARARRDAWLINRARRTLAEFVDKHCCGKQYDSCTYSPCRYASVHGCQHPLHPKHHAQ